MKNNGGNPRRINPLANASNILDAARTMYSDAEVIEDAYKRLNLQGRALLILLRTTDMAHKHWGGEGRLPLLKLSAPKAQEATDGK